MRLPFKANRKSDLSSTETPQYNSPQYREGRFYNSKPPQVSSSSSIIRLMWNYYFNKPEDCEPSAPIPVQALSSAELRELQDGAVIRLGHSSVLMKLDNALILTDPVFSRRASPFGFMGPSRFHEPPASLAQLPELDVVILSHNHYDHLDKSAILTLAQKTRLFLSPLGVGELLCRWGIQPSKIKQLDWWQSAQANSFNFTATPAQHFSGRSPWDGNQTLWCSWVIQSDRFKVFFSGDSGYFDGFKEIGDRYGPFDLSLMETGAYNHQWTYVHMTPEESLQAHLDINSKWLLPIHNGTFDLAMHAWYDPFERIEKLAAQHNVALATPQMGEVFDLNAPATGKRWWRDLISSEAQQPSSNSIATET